MCAHVRTHAHAHPTCPSIYLESTVPDWSPGHRPGSLARLSRCPRGHRTCPDAALQPRPPGGLPCPPGHSDEPPSPCRGGAGGGGWVLSTSRGCRSAGKAEPSPEPPGLPGKHGSELQPPRARPGRHGEGWEGTEKAEGSGHTHASFRRSSETRDHLIGGWPPGSPSDTKGQWWP